NSLLVGFGYTLSWVVSNSDKLKVTVITTSVASLVQSPTVCVTKNVYSPSVSASEVSAVSVKSSSVYQVRFSPAVTTTSAKVCPSSSDCGDSISGGVIPSHGSSVTTSMEMLSKCK